MKEYYFHRPLSREWDWESFFDLKITNAQEYFYWENIVTNLYLEFYNFFDKNGLIEHTVSLNIRYRFKKYLDREYANVSKLNIISLNEIQGDIDKITTLSKQKKLLSCEDVIFLSKCSARGLCYFGLVDMKSNSRLYPFNSDFLSYIVVVDDLNLDINTIFSKKDALYCYLNNQPFSKEEDDMEYELLNHLFNG